MVKLQRRKNEPFELAGAAMIKYVDHDTMVTFVPKIMTEMTAGSGHKLRIDASEDNIDGEEIVMMGERLN